MKPTNAGETPLTTILPLTRGNRGVSCEQASCQVTAFRFWTPSPGVKNWTLVSPELFLRRLPVLLRMELLRRIELRFLSEFWWDSSLFCRVWIRMEGFSSSSRALHRGVVTFKEKKGTLLKTFFNNLAEPEVNQLWYNWSFWFPFYPVVLDCISHWNLFVIK